MKKSNFVYFLFISKSAFLIIILLIATAMLNASIVSQTYRVDNPKLTVKEGYDYLELNNCAMTGTPTEPLLPYIQVRLLLPSGEEVFKVDVNRSGKVKVGEGYKIYPTQYDIPTSQAHLRKFTKPNEDIYSSDLAYPATAYRNYDTGYYRGHSIAYADVCPVEYIPKTGEVFYYTSVTVTLTTSYSDIASRAFRTRFRGDSDTEDYIKDLVQNPAMLSSYPVQNTTRQYYETDYLIITSNAYEECFESFAKFKKLQGYYTVTKTVESIYSNYTGVDNQDKIRNCIIDYYDNHGTDYVLLGGDVEIVPQRDLYGHTVTGDGPVYDNIPADLYYICLDRVGSGPGPDWNVDNDDKWGEYDLDDPILGDITEADFLAEMYIGRICADSETEFANALHKQIMYQKSPVAADNKKAIMVGEKLWDGLCGDEHKEQIRLGGTYDGYTTAGLANIGVVSQLQYASAYPDSTWPVQDLIDKMNSGATYINHLGHGNTYGYMNFNNSNGTVDLLTSDGINHNYHFVYSQTCYGSSFDNRDSGGTYLPNDCMTEYFTTNETGVMGVIGNSRYGWEGAGQTFDRYFFDAMCKSSNPINQVGKMQNYSRYQAGYGDRFKRWTYYALNLFGDPALEFWKYDNLSRINYVTTLTTPYSGMTMMSVQVNPAVTGMKVSVYTDTGIYGNAYTNSSGIAAIYFNQPLITQTTIYGMVTKDNYYPYEFPSGWYACTWTGSYSNNWHDNRNWINREIPNSSKDAMIPAVCLRDPIIFNSNGNCKNLTIESGHTLKIQTLSLNASGNVYVKGGLSLENTNATINIDGSINFYRDCTFNMAADTYMTVKGNISGSTANIFLTNGTVIMSGPNNAWISISGRKDIQFNKLDIVKSNAEVEFAGEFTGSLIIKTSMTIGSTTTFRTDNDNNDIILYGSLISIGNMCLDYSKFTFKGVSGSISLSSGSYLNDLYVNGSNVLLLSTNLTVKGNLNITSGFLNGNAKTITLHGNWVNNGGPPRFTETGTIVQFVGNTDQSCSSEEFNRIVINKPTGAVTVAAGKIVKCNEFDWAAGTLSISGGSFTANDVLDTGIQGNFVITGGNLVLGQDSSANVDLNANITINNSGTVKIKGGNGNASRWAYLRDASLTMSGGTLDFSSSGINIGNYGHTFNDIITGGTIKTIGDFKVDYGSFYPAGGTIELYGSGNAILHNYIASSFYNVKINKTISRENERSQIVTIDQNTSIDHDLTITSGTLTLENATLTIGRNLDVSGTLLLDEADEIIDLAGNATWENPAVTAMTGGTMYVGGNWFCDSFYTDAIGAGFNLVFDGSAESTIIAEDYHAYLGTLTINKTGSGCKFLQQSKDFIVKGNITVNGTSYLKDEYTAITVNGTITIQQNGSMTVGYQYTSTARITTNGLNIGGTLTMEGGSVKILSSYIQQTTGVLTIEEGGSFTLDTPYTGTYHSFAGVTTLNGGNFKITNNGMQFGSSSNFTANDGVVLLGWGLRALTSGTFQQTSGTFEFIGNRSCDIQLASNNWFNNLTINKTGTPADVYLSTNVTVKKDLNIVAGNLLCFHHLLTVNWDVVITGGVLNAGYSDDEIKVGRNWNNHVGPSAFIEGNGRVTFFSNLDGKIYHNENFNNLKMNKEIVNLSYLSIYTDVTVNVSGTVDLISGTLLLRDGALFEVAGDMNISGSRVWNYFLEYEMMIHVGGVTSIASSAEVLLNNGSLECDGILNLYGKLDVGNGLFTLHGDFVNLSNSILNINNGRFICTAPYASAWQNINGHFALTGASGIFEFQDRGIQLTSTFDGQISGGKIRTGRGFLATTQNIFRPTGGTLEFFGELAATLTCSNGNWINDLSISKTNAAIVLGSGLTVKGDLMIVSGALSSSSYTINLNGMWDNQVGASGFGEGTGTVCFQGTGNRIINGNETFYNLSIDLTPGSSTPYMYSSGAVTMMNNLNIISGVVNLTMNAIWAVLGDITISYGACLNIAGVTGSPTLYAQGNITDNSSTIDATHGFYADGPCTLILNGFQEQYLNTQQSSVKLGNLSLAYYSWFYPADALIVQGDFQMSGTTCWNSSTTGLTHTFMGDFIMAGGTYWFDNTGTVTFTGSEAATISILGEANFGNAIINKTPVSRIEGPVLSLSNDLYLVGNGTLTIQSGVLDLNGHDLYTSGDILINADGKLSMDAGASLNLNSNKSMIVNDGGEFESIGLPGSNATVGSQSGYYAFRISSGGYIAAENTIFEDMNISGIYVMSGATVDELHAFNGCTFRNGEAGGVLLVINNSQFLDINDAIFPTNTWSGGFNVRKTYNTGSISFLNETGNYTSSIYEDDPYMRINWSSEIPVIEMDPVSFSFGEVGLYQQESRFFTIRNTGTGNLIGSIISTDEFLVYVSSFRSGLPTRQKPTRNDRYQVEFMVFPMDSIQVEVRFRPQLPIFYEETIIINHNAAGDPISIDVDGMGTGPVMTSTPGMINKGVLPNGTWSSTLTIGNEGNETLSYDVYAFYSGAVIMNVVSEGFENAFPPASWTETQVIGTEGDWSRITETIHPQNYTPQQGSYMAVFNSYTSHSNNRTRLETGNLNLVDITSAFMTFWMFHDTDYPSYYDRIQVQVSVNGGDWINVGTAVARYIGVLGWQQHGVSLINWDGMSNVRVGFLAISEYGNDMHIDDVYIFGVSQNPDWLSFNGVSTVNGSIDEGDPVDEISIDIDMSGLANGWYSAQIHIDSNSPINPSAWIPVEIIVGNPGMLLMPEDLAFGSCFTGTETTRVFSITSTGTIGLHGTITTPAGYSVVRTYMPMWENRESGTDDRTEPRNTLEYNLSTMETANFLVTFYPPAAGDYNGNILITEEYMADRTISVTGECFGYCIVETDTVYALGASFATVDGAVLSDGNRTILSRGICWNAFGNPTVEDDTLAVAGTMGAFSAELTGLFHNTQYYVRTYARNQIGVAYGDEIAFTTMNPTLYYSGVPLADFGGILVGELSPEASFTISGEYLVDMVMLNVLQGFEISLTSEEDRSQVREFGTQIFLYPVGETLAETNIYVRFTPEETIDYNESITILTVGGSNPDVMLTGRGIDFPSVFTDITSAVTLNSVIMHGTIISDGNDTILNSGFCWDTEGNPTLADDNVNLGFQTGAFYSIIDSLQSNTTYYYCAWAENSGGVAYGHTLSFTTSLNPHIYSSTETIDDFGEVPMEVSSEPQSFTISAQQLSSNLCLSTTGAFEIFVPDARMSTRNYTNSLEITPVNNNIAETTVMVRFSPSAAGQAAGTIYLTSLDADTLEISLSGTGITLPVVVADTLTSITATSANASGHLVDNGWGTITVNGFCWGVNTEPTLADNYSEEAVAENFSSTLTNLNPGTTYFVRAYAVNGAGINYGNELSFMTESVILDTPSNIVISIAGEDVLLNWDAVPGAGSYYLYCSTEPYPADWGYPIDITTANTYTDTGAIFGSIRFYRIIAHSESLGRR